MTTKNILCWTDIPVLDLERAMEFYSSILGEPVVRQTFSGFEFALLPHAGESASGCLSVDEDNKPSQNGPLIYLSVEGRLDDAVEKASHCGGTVLEGVRQIGPYGFRSVILDTEGNRLALHSQTA